MRNTHAGAATTTAEQLVATTAWADVRTATVDVAENLKFMMKLTADEFQAWETNNEPDESLVSSADARAMGAERRLAHLARLIRSLALKYGVETDDHGRTPGGKLIPGSPAALLDELHRISMRRSSERPRHEVTNNLRTDLCAIADPEWLTDGEFAALAEAERALQGWLRPAEDARRS